MLVITDWWNSIMVKVVQPPSQQLTINWDWIAAIRFIAINWSNCFNFHYLFRTDWLDSIQLLKVTNSNVDSFIMLNSFNSSNFEIDSILESQEVTDYYLITIAINSMADCSSFMQNWLN